MSEQPPLSDALMAGRYRQADDETGVLIDTAPWRRCWSCGTTGNTAAEPFCSQCGASLAPRRYPFRQTSVSTPGGAALLTSLPDDPARAILPAVVEQFDDGDQRFTVLAPGEGSRPPLPLDELAALRIGRELATLLAVIHHAGLALGPLRADDLLVSTSGATMLRDADGLHADPEGEAQATDLRALGALLEELTATPRVTQRLDDQQAAEALGLALPGLLRELRTGGLTDAAALARRLDDLVRERTSVFGLRHLVGAASDTGMVRDHNEDSLLVVELHLNQNNQPASWGIYIVADGMGGHAAGEVASDLAIRGAAETLASAYLAPLLSSRQPFDEAALKELLRQAVRHANEAVVAEGRSRGNDMGTTITMALVTADRAYVANVGDSRTYLFRDGELRRVSKDHSLVMRLVDLGQITYDEVYTHPQRNAVLRSLGDRADVEIDVFVEQVRPGDTLLLCSDGQWEMTRDDEIARMLGGGGSAQQIADRLVAAANAAGGEDNIAALVVQFAL